MDPCVKSAYDGHGPERTMAVKKPGWWAGSWFVKTVLIWLCGFLVWLPIFPRSPRLASIIFLLSMIPFALLYGSGVIGSWLRLIVFVYTTVTGSVSGEKHRKA
jgi:hypothetical protein